MRLVIVSLLLYAVSASAPSAQSYGLVEDMGASGFQHLCRYSNGKVYAFNATDICPVSVNPPGLDQMGPVTGFHRGEYDDGMTKVCAYDTVSGERFLRVNGTEPCPMSYIF